jgi:hypothetical protein
MAVKIGLEPILAELNPAVLSLLISSSGEEIKTSIE